MLTITRLEDLASLNRPLHLALGVFDGVHLGHQTVIAAAVEAAELDGIGGVLTFDPHPIRVIAPQKAPSSLLATLHHKSRIMAALGVELFIPLHFDETLSKTEAGTFIDRLLAAPVKTLSVGEDWRFGRNRAGDITYLGERAAAHQCRLIAVPPVMLDGERISSTRIRQAIRDGNLSGAARMLGRPYTVSGTVIKGRMLGRTIGFPTANVTTGEVQLPPDGVWAVTAQVDEDPPRQGMANLGFRPTVGGVQRSLEVHLFDFSADLYGKDLEVEFQQFIRPEKQFPSLEDLRQQIKRDALDARNALNA